VKITRAEPGGLEGKGLWRPAALGFRPTYENPAMKRYLEGAYVAPGSGTKGGKS
jgi:nitrate reductase alpha subunit